jgi:hypothetical protein
MDGLKVRIRAVLDAAQPVTVECCMTDFDGQTHLFRGPVTLFSSELSPLIPGDGIIRCTVRRETALFAEISTALPDGIESTMGVNSFRVHRSDLTDNA